MEIILQRTVRASRALLRRLTTHYSKQSSEIKTMSYVISARKVRHHIITSDLGPTHSSSHPVTCKNLLSRLLYKSYLLTAFDILALFLCINCKWMHSDIPCCS